MSAKLAQIVGQVRRDVHHKRAQQVTQHGEARLELRRETLTQQFIDMEQALSMLNSQSQWLSSQIAALQSSNSQ